MSDNASDIDNARERGDAFHERLGLGRPFYLRTVEQAVNFANLTAPVDPSAVPWASYGARNIAGRIRAIAQNPANPEMLYAGSADSVNHVLIGGAGRDTLYAGEGHSSYFMNQTVFFIEKALDLVAGEVYHGDPAGSQSDHYETTMVGDAIKADVSFVDITLTDVREISGFSGTLGGVGEGRVRFASRPERPRNRACGPRALPDHGKTAISAAT